jgi:hypothetical protein
MRNEIIDNVQTENETFRKTRPDDVLGNLPAEKKNRIIRWLGEMSYEEVLERIAKPEPEGLGIKTHYTSLRRFYTKNLPEDLVSFRREEMIRLRGLAECCEAEPAPYDALIREFFTKGVFYQSLGLPQRDPNFRENMRLLLDLRAQELKEKHLELQKERLQIDRSREKPDVKFQIFAASQTQIEQTVTNSVTSPPSIPVLESREPLPTIQDDALLGPPAPAMNQPNKPAASTEKHDLARFSTK